MATDSDFVIHLDTEKVLHDATFARRFLSEWLNHPLTKLRPERWGRGEPVRKSIASTDFEQLVAEWCATALVFKRLSKPKMTVSIAWRKRKGQDPRPFPWDAVAWIAKDAGAAAVREFFTFMIGHFDPAFASLTTQADSRLKHFVKRPAVIGGRQIGIAERFEGLHVLDTLPGIYWMTYFGPQAVVRLGEEALAKVPVGRLEPLNTGALLTAYEDPSLIGSPTALNVEHQIACFLGAQNFFRKDAQSRSTDLPRETH